MQTVESTVFSLSVGDPVAHGALAAFPLISNRASALQYLLMSEALRHDLVTVREVSMGGSVPRLAVENRADAPVLVVDGEEFVGAKQNRIANLSMLIPAGRTTVIPVSCVERGRWSYCRARPTFADSDRLHYAEGRAMNRFHVQANMRRTGARRSNQRAVWRGIEAKATRMRAQSRTAAMGSIYERHGAPIAEFVARIAPVPGQVGAVFAIGDRRLGLDLFDKPETFAAMLPKLVRSYAIDALDEARYGGGVGRPPTSEGVVWKLLDYIQQATFDCRAAVGVGQDVQIVARDLVAGALVANDTVVHLTVFAKTFPAWTGPQPRRRRGMGHGLGRSAHRPCGQAPRVGGGVAQDEGAAASVRGTQVRGRGGRRLGAPSSGRRSLRGCTFPPGAPL